MKTKLIALVSTLFCMSAFATDFQIYWDNSIPGAHIYQWFQPRINDAPPLVDCYADLGELPIGASSYLWLDDAVYGGSIVITTPDGFLAFAEVTGSAGVGAIQVWGWGGDFGGDIFEDSVNMGWDFGVIEFALTTPHIIPDGLGGWTEGDPYAYAASPAPVQSLPGKRLAKGHAK